MTRPNPEAIADAAQAAAVGFTVLARVWIRFTPLLQALAGACNVRAVGADLGADRENEAASVAETP